MWKIVTLSEYGSCCLCMHRHFMVNTLTHMHTHTSVVTCTLNDLLSPIVSSYIIDLFCFCYLTIRLSPCNRKNISLYMQTLHQLVNQTDGYITRMHYQKAHGYNCDENEQYNFCKFHYNVLDFHF